MRPFLVVIVLAMLVAAGSAANAAPATSNKGLRTACERSGNDNPCDYAGLIGDTVVGTGESRTYEDGNFTATGTIVVQSGGSVLVDNATIVFESTSGGILVEPGGTLTVLDSILREDEGGSAFVLDLAPTSFFTLNRTRLLGGEGIRLATENANFSGNHLEGIPLALHLRNVSVSIQHNEFRNNTVAVNQTGGAPTLSRNRFDGGLVCVRDWLSDPTITHNVFRGCHVGIYHHRSESDLSLNDMEDRGDPPGAGILVEDTMSPTIQGNRISNYGTGILIIRARAYVYDNEIFGNVGDGVRVVSNSAPMNITRNHIHHNGGNGISLVDVSDIDVSDNLVENNSGDGLSAHLATVLAITGNQLMDNLGDGARVGGAPGTSFAGNLASGNGGRGFRFEPGSEGTSLGANVARGNARHGFSLESSALTLVENTASANGVAGFWIGNATGVTLAAEQATGNGIAGFYVVHAHHVNASSVGAFGNGAWGYVIAGGGAHEVFDANASGNGDSGFVVNDLSNDTPANVTLSFARAIGNGGDGLHAVMHSKGTRLDARNGWWEDNVGFGVRNHLVGNAVVDARDGYWGSATGPTHADNPDGTGDEVSDGVLYEPFRTVPPGTLLDSDGTLY